MADRGGKLNCQRFPRRKNDQGQWLCRICGQPVPKGKFTFCNQRCLRDFYMKTDWRRVRQVIYARDGGICMICGNETHGKYHIDHVHPIAAGGDEWDLDNLQLTCPECNLKKGSKTETQLEISGCQETDSNDPIINQLNEYRNQISRLLTESHRVDHAMWRLALWVSRKRSKLDCVTAAKQFIKTGQWGPEWETGWHPKEGK
jgi:hypothetical protein